MKVHIVSRSDGGRDSVQSHQIFPDVFKWAPGEDGTLHLWRDAGGDVLIQIASFRDWSSVFEEPGDETAKP